MMSRLSINIAQTLNAAIFLVVLGTRRFLKCDSFPSDDPDHHVITVHLQSVKYIKSKYCINYRESTLLSVQIPAKAKFAPLLTR